MNEQRWAFAGGDVITPYRRIVEGFVAGTGKTVEFVGTPAQSDLLADREVRDISGLIIAPGFVDIHVHGGDGSDFMDGSLEAFATICACHARGGTTALLPTTVASSVEAITQTLQLVQEAMATTFEGAQVLGAHVEGPWFAVARKGAHDKVWEPQPAEVDVLLEWPHVVKRLTLAPELTGALEAIRALAGAGILISAGHTDITYTEMLAAIDAGVSHVTHLWNQCSLVTLEGPYRRGGCVETALLEDALTVELIADGHHVPPELMKLAVKCKGLDKLCIVTDAMRGAGKPEGTSWPVGPQDSKVIGIIRNGVAVLPDNSAFASSVSTMDRLVKNMVNLVGLSVTEAIRVATLTPARILGIAGCKGRLRPGYDADIVLLDQDLNVLETIVQGHTVYRKAPPEATKEAKT